MSVNNKVRAFYVHLMSRLRYLLHNLDCSSTYACNCERVMTYGVQNAIHSAAHTLKRKKTLLINSKKVLK